MDVLKWRLPGWRIEQRFSNQVLIGNWNEERRLFERGTHKSDSTHRTDFKRYENFVPDITSRRSAVLKSDGLDKRLLFSHHGECERYSNNLISWYDQQFNGRETNESKLPTLRKWDKKTIAWVPEKSDHPLTGPPTNFGMVDAKKAKWKKQQELENIGDYVSTYKLSYNEHPRDSLVTNHHASPKPLSSHFTPHNRINKDLHLRDVRLGTAPEHPPLGLVATI